MNANGSVLNWPSELNISFALANCSTSASQTGKLNASPVRMAPRDQPSTRYRAASSDLAICWKVGCQEPRGDGGSSKSIRFTPLCQAPWWSDILRALAPSQAGRKARIPPRRHEEHEEGIYALRAMPERTQARGAKNSRFFV